jgi:6-phosphogluconolactonase
MKLEVFDDAEAVAKAAAAVIAADARTLINRRGLFALAVSGGHTPWIMLYQLTRLYVAWAGVHLFQVDERVAPAGDPDRNLTHLTENLIKEAAFEPGHVHAMDVESSDLNAAAAKYARDIARTMDRTLDAVSPPVLDFVHLGLGPDGHTASLVPGDPVLEVTDKDVAITGVYQGRRRMTLTYPVLNRARRVLWVVTGAEKLVMLQRLMDGDQTIPAGRVRRDEALVLADRAAAGPAR